MQMQWNISQPDPSLVQQIQDHLGCGRIVAAILANRRITAMDDAASFFNPSLDTLPPPTLVQDMDKAVHRIVCALQREEKILVIGDYDADGVTATAVLVTFLQTAGACVDYHIPHRMREGYGFHPEHVVQIGAPRAVGLIITVDCGSSSHKAVAAAKRFGMDVIVTDHHNIDDSIPDACAVVNPKRSDTPRDLRNLAGVGVAFYLTIALRAALRAHGWWKNHPEPNLKSLCDLVAIGTIADIVPLRGVNRVLVKTGLNQINTAARPGIQSLLTAGGVHRKTVSSDDIAYRLAPRINAAGRMAHAKTAYDLLTETDAERADYLSETLQSLNSRRRDVENELFREIVGRVESRPDLLMRNCLFMAGQGWHEGVLGIVAAKLVSQFHKPVILISNRDGVGKGSGRSIAQVDLFQALSRCADLMEKFGGHHSAAGLTVKTDNISALKLMFEQAVASMLDGQNPLPRIEIDSEILFDEITPDLLDELERLEPFGADNPAPVFLARDIRVVKAYMVGKGHRRMLLCQNGGHERPIQAIHFNLKPDAPRRAFFSRMAFRLQWNRYKGEKEIQIVVEAV